MAGEGGALDEVDDSEDVLERLDEKDGVLPADAGDSNSLLPEAESVLSSAVLGSRTNSAGRGSSAAFVR